MTEESAKRWFGWLVEMLNRLKLESVVTEVSGTIRLGKLRSKKLRADDAWRGEDKPFVLTTESRRKTSQAFTISEAFTHREELLSAISSLSVDLAAIEGRTASLIECSARTASAPETIRQPIIILHDENISHVQQFRDSGQILCQTSFLKLRRNFHSQRCRNRSMTRVRRCAA